MFKNKLIIDSIDYEINFNQYYLAEFNKKTLIKKENKIKKILKSLIKYIPKNILGYFLKKKRSIRKHQKRIVLIVLAPWECV